MKKNEILSNHEITVTELKESDIEQLIPILETHVGAIITHKIWHNEISDDTKAFSSSTVFS